MHHNTIKSTEKIRATDRRMRVSGGKGRLSHHGDASSEPLDERFAHLNLIDLAYGSAFGSLARSKCLRKPLRDQGYLIR